MIRDLLIHKGTRPTEEEMRVIKETKASLDPGFQVQIRKAAIGSIGRVLAIGSVPDYIVFDGYAYVDSVEAPEFRKALAWVLGGVADRGPMLAADQLSEVFGTPVRELTSREIHRNNIDRGLFSQTMKFQEK